MGRRLDWADHLTGVPSTNYCGPLREGKDQKFTTYGVDKCCAFHDFQCGYDQEETGHRRGASASAQHAKSWMVGIHGGKAGHCACEAALVACAHAAQFECADARAAIVSTVVSFAPCWDQYKIRIPYPCGVSWCCTRVWFAKVCYPCRLRWCHWTVKFELLFLAAWVQPQYMFQPKACSNEHVQWNGAYNDGLTPSSCAVSGHPCWH